MLCLNHIRGASTVSLGLMNGVRGVIVAIVYASAVETRIDGISQAGVGYPKGNVVFEPILDTVCL
jgi:hypothetical protein